MTYPSFTKATLPDTCALSGSGDTETSINLTNFQAVRTINMKKKKLIKYLNKYVRERIIKWIKINTYSRTIIYFFIKTCAREIIASQSNNTCPRWPPRNRIVYYTLQTHTRILHWSVWWIERREFERFSLDSRVVYACYFLR